MQRLLFFASVVALAVSIAGAASVIEHADILLSYPENVRVLELGSKFTSFARDKPVVLDPQFLTEYGAAGYLHVHFDPNGENDYEATSSPYVAALRNASVCGSEGDVWDNEGRLFRANTWVKHPASKLEAWRKEAEEHGVKHFKRLASSIHRVSFMYFHFLTETLPRIAKFAPLLKADPELKLLTYGTSFERAWTKKLGIDDSQLVTFDPLFAYRADELLITNPVEIARTPREDLETMLGLLRLPAPLPAAERTDLVYVSRRLASDRKQTNEDALLEALAAEAAAHGMRLVVHDGNPSLSVDDTIDMFRRAKAVMGPNGAGLAHMLFAAPGTPLVELMFINNTGMDLWHLTAALKQKYYMVPLPRSYWLDPGSDVPIEQAVATLRLALGQISGTEPRCPRGSAPGASGACETCPAGTFSTGYDSNCMACSPGWVSERPGGGFCRVCPTSTFAATPTACSACPRGTLAAMPGSTAQEQCLDPQALDEVKESWLPVGQVVAKVSAYYQAIVTRRATAAVGGFDSLPLMLQDRILGELDACSGYYTYNAYGGCSKQSPPPPPAGTSYPLLFRALRNGAHSSCSVSLVDPLDPLNKSKWRTLTTLVDAYGYLKSTVTATTDVVALMLTNCTDTAQHKYGYVTPTTLVPLSAAGDLTSVVSPLVSLASAGLPSPKSAAEFAAFYAYCASYLNISAAAYGTAMDLLTFDYVNATFNSTDRLTVTKGSLLYLNSLQVAGVIESFTALLTPLLAAQLPSSSSSGRRLLGTTIQDGIWMGGTTNKYVTFSEFIPGTATTSNGDLLSSLGASGSKLTNSSLLATSANTTAGKLGLLAKTTAGRRLLADSVNLTALISAVADSVSSSLAIQEASLQRLADAVKSGEALSASDLNGILTVANQIAATHALVAAAAVDLATGALNETAFRASYTGDALTQLIYSQEVSIELAASDDKKGINKGAAIGGAIGGFFGLVLLVCIVVFVVKKRKAAEVRPKQTQDAEPSPAAAAGVSAAAAAAEP